MDNDRSGVPCRRATVDTTYEGKAITTTLDNYNTAFSYTDCASGTSDSIKLDIFDPDGRWRAAWTPWKGDKMESIISVKDWNREGDDTSLKCGSFVIDSLDISGEPSFVSIGAVSAPVEDSFHIVEKTRTWESTTLKQIANDIAEEAKLSLEYDADEITINKKEQSKESNSDFLNKLVEDFGLCLKVYDKKLVVFDRLKYKAKPPVATIKIEEMAPNWKYSTDLEGLFTGVKIDYTHTSTIQTTTKKGKPKEKKKKEKLTYEYGEGPRWLKINEKIDNDGEAERIAKGRLEKENHGKTKLSISTLGNTSIVASQCVTIAGLGPTVSGKYYVDKVTHSLGGDGYKCEYELVQVETLTEDVIFDAIDRLAELVVITDKGYWRGNYKQVQYLDQLLVDMAQRLKVKPVTQTVADTKTALNIFTEAGVINRPSYWEGKFGAMPNLKFLFIDGANSVKSEVIPIG